MLLLFFLPQIWILFYSSADIYSDGDLQYSLEQILSEVSIVSVWRTLYSPLDLLVLMQIGWANVSSALNIQLNHSHRLASLLLITKTERKTASQFKLEPNSQTPWAREEEANVIKLSARFPFDSSPAFFQGGGGSLLLQCGLFHWLTGNGTIKDHKPSKTSAWKTHKQRSIPSLWIDLNQNQHLPFSSKMNCLLVYSFVFAFFPFLRLTHLQPSG